LRVELFGLGLAGAVFLRRVAIRTCLEVEQLGVPPTGLHQFIMRPAFCADAVCEYHNLVSIFQGAQSMRYQQSSHPAMPAAHHQVDLMFSDGI